MKPTKRGIGVSGAAVLITVIAVLLFPALGNGGFAIPVAVALFLLLDALMLVPARRCHLDYKLPAACYVGGSAQADVRLYFDHLERPLSLSLLLDTDANLVPADVMTFRAEPDGTSIASITLQPRKRGKAVLHRLWLSWNSPWQCWTRIKIVEIEAEVAALPNIPFVKQEAVKFFSKDAFFGNKRQEQAGQGSDFSALREYVQGLDHRAIDWKHSARHRQLVCKEFDTERNHQIILAFDTGHLMNSPVDGIAKLDHAINAGLLLSFVSLRHGDRVGVYGFASGAEDYAEPVGGTQGFAVLQKTCAGLTYQAAETNFTLGLAALTGKVTRRSLIIVMTDFEDTTTAELMMESIERLASKHLVLFVTIEESSLAALSAARPDTADHLSRSVIAQDMLKERKLVLERLRRIGVQCIEAPSRQIGTAMINNYLHIKQREMI